MLEGADAGNVRRLPLSLSRRGGMVTTAQINVLDRRLKAVERRQVAQDRKLDDLLKAVGMLTERLMNGNHVEANNIEEEAKDERALRRDRMLMIAGLTVALAGIGLEAFAPQFADWATVAMVLAGGTLIPHNRIVELVTAWRSRRNGNDKNGGGHEG